MAELYPVIEPLVREARDAGIGVTLDAEEAERLELSLLLVDKLLRERRDARLRGLRARGAGLPEARLRHARVADQAPARDRPAHHAAPGQGRVLGQRDQARAGARARGLSRCSRASRTPTCRTSPARGCSRAPASASIRSSPRTTRTPSRTSPKCSAATRTASNSSACTAWARSCTTAWCAGPGASTPAASTRRWARTKTCCRISCGACSRTAPTPRSSIASSMRACRPRKWWPIPSPRSTRSSAWRIRAFRCR